MAKNYPADGQPSRTRVVFGWIGKIFGTIVLTGFLAFLIFVCIFAIYIKKDLSKQVDFSMEDINLSQTSVIYYMDRKTGQWQELKKLYSEENRVWVKLSDIPKNLQEACIAIEDKRFREHNGVDWLRSAKAGVELFLGNKSLYGASTITQQLIKNVTHDDEITVRRKLLEILRALEFEKTHSKNEILELYLNIIPLGEGCSGVQAASEVYFGKDVEELSLAECASLIGITNNPSLYDPYLHPEKNKERQEIILREMLDQGKISQSQYEKAKAEKLVLVNRSGEKRSGDYFSYFEDQVINEVVYDLMEKTGYEYKVALKMLQVGGYKIYATIDPAVQAEVDKIYQDMTKIPKTKSSQQLESAIVITDNETGDVVAMAGGVGEKKGSLIWNKATKSHLQPGSILKPISVYAPALETGLITPASVRDDVPFQFTDTAVWPKNADGIYHGLQSMRDAVAKSLNTIAVELVSELGKELCFNFVQDRFGLDLVEERQTSSGVTLTDMDYAPLALGGLHGGVTVKDMAQAYTVFPSDGLFREARTYTKVLDSKGEVVLDNTQDSHQAISEKTTWYSNYLMMGTVEYGTGMDGKLDHMAVAGKTGTTDDDKDLWFAGYTPYYTGVVWCGYEYPEEIVLEGSTENPAIYLWREVMQGVHQGLPEAEFHKPAQVVKASYCRDSGLLATDACRNDPRGDRTIEGELYLEDVPTESCSTHWMVNMCKKSQHVANDYCSKAPGNSLYKQSMLNIVRQFRTPGIPIEDQTYVVSDQPLTPGYFRPETFQPDPMNMECYLHSEKDLPKKEEEQEEDEQEEGSDLGSLLEGLFRPTTRRN